MKIIEQIYTKKECFTVYEDGHITCEKGKFEPTKPFLKDIIPLPQKPNKLSEYDMVSTNCFGKEIRKNFAIWRWELDLQRAKEQNAYYHRQQLKEFKRKICSIRKDYHRQQSRKKDNNFLERIGNYMFCGERT